MKILQIIESVTGITGFILTCVWYDWKIAILIFLFMTSLYQKMEMNKLSIKHDI